MARVVPTVASLRYVSSCLRSEPTQCSSLLRTSRRQSPCLRTYALGGCRQTYDHPGQPQVRYASGFGRDLIYKEFTLDNDIPQRRVRLKNPKDNSLSPPGSITKLFSMINRETQVIHLLHNDEAEGFAIVEVVDKDVLRERLKVKEEKQAEQAKKLRQSKTKQLELNWAISDNDLQLKLRQLRDFLEKGRRVEVMLASKKRQRKASPEEAENVVKAIQKMTSGMDGVRELVPMEGKVGEQAILTFQQLQQKSPAKSVEKESKDQD